MNWALSGSRFRKWFGTVPLCHRLRVIVMDLSGSRILNCRPPYPRNADDGASGWIVYASPSIIRHFWSIMSSQKLQEKQTHRAISCFLVGSEYLREIRP